MRTLHFGLNHFVIQVESVHTTVADLAAQGVTAEEPSPPTARASS